MIEVGRRDNELKKKKKVVGKSFEHTLLAMNEPDCSAILT